MDENESCFYVELPHQVLENWGMIIPKRHCETVFDLSEQEISDSLKLLKKQKFRIDQKISPDGYNVGWNCYLAAGQKTPHAHMHLIPRFSDEPLVGKGIRHWFKSEENRRDKKIP